MGFRPITDIIPPEGKSFNSAISSNFKDLYDNIVKTKYQMSDTHMPHRTFAPSSFRCDRISWFRLKGVEPDNTEPDMAMNFKAMLGEACHREIQENLVNNIGEQWVDVEEYLKEHVKDFKYSTTKNKDSYETQIEFLDPPIRFACDGIVKIGDTYYLLEIKSSEPKTLRELYEPKPQHIDQVRCYCALLGLDKALVLYIDRVIDGSTKCYEVTVPDYQKQEIFDRMKYVQECVENDIAPERLPKGDNWCSFCKYKKRCKQWG